MGNCFQCAHLIQDATCMHCNHINAVRFLPIEEPCDNCGRKPGEEISGCGACIGRGAYCYPEIYDQCDCDGFENKTMTP